MKEVDEIPIVNATTLSKQLAICSETIADLVKIQTTFINSGFNSRTTRKKIPGICQNTY